MTFVKITGLKDPPRVTVCVRLPVITSLALLEEATELEDGFTLEEDCTELEDGFTLEEDWATLDELASLRPRHFTLSICKVPVVPEVPWICQLKARTAFWTSSIEATLPQPVSWAKSVQ